MKNGIASAIGFIFGGALGAGATYVVMRKRYDKKLADGIASIQEMYSGSNEEKVVEDTSDEDEEDHNIEPVDEPEEIKPVVKTKATKKSSPKKSSKSKKDADAANEIITAAGYARRELVHEDWPYVINPDEYGQYADYETENLTWYQVDQILANEVDEEIEDIDGTIGKDWLDHFDPDVVYVRNDKKKTDYEIVIDNRSFEEVVGNSYFGSKINREGK